MIATATKGIWIVGLLCSNVYATTRTLLHITDAHLDPRYSPYAPSSCLVGDWVGTKCCRQGQVSTARSHPASVLGEYDCDAPLTLIDRTLAWGKSALAPSLVLYSGDSADHNVLAQSFHGNVRAVHAVAHAFLPFADTPLWVVHGNHDTFPVDQTPSHWYPDMLAATARPWKRWLSPEAYLQFSTHGFYQQELQPNLLVITINSVIYDARNWFSISNRNQWVWLNATLAKARGAGQSVWISTHIAPYQDESTPRLVELVDIVNSYLDIVKAVFAGHSHRDEFLLYNKWSAWVPSSLVPDHHHACVRVYEYDDQSYHIMDYTQYCAPVVNTTRLTYTPRYRFTTEYDLPDASFTSWTRLYEERFLQPKYQKRYKQHFQEGQHAYVTCLDRIDKRRH